MEIAQQDECVRSGSPEADAKVEITAISFIQKEILERVNNEMEKASYKERKNSRADVVHHRQLSA